MGNNCPLLPMKVTLMTLFLTLFAAAHIDVVGQTVSERAIAENRLAVQKINAGDYAIAIPLLKTVVEQEPRFANAYYNLGTAYYLSGKSDEAIQALIRATTIQTFFPSAYDQLGVVLAAQ